MRRRASRPPPARAVEEITIEMGQGSQTGFRSAPLDTASEGEQYRSRRLEETLADSQTQANRPCELETRFKELVARQARPNAAFDHDKNDAQAAGPTFPFHFRHSQQLSPYGELGRLCGTLSPCATVIMESSAPWVAAIRPNQSLRYQQYLPRLHFGTRRSNGTLPLHLLPTKWIMPR